jgi:hypothetical protein
MKVTEKGERLMARLIAKYIGPVTWAWVIILGGLMITPGGVTCIKCGPGLTQIMGVVSILVGVAALVANQRAIRA